MRSSFAATCRRASSSPNMSTSLTRFSAMRSPRSSMAFSTASGIRRGRRNLPPGAAKMVDGGEREGGKRLGEFEIIARYFAPLATDAASLALRDDTAVLRPPESHEIVISYDTIVEGVHFIKDDNSDIIGLQALEVNLSDVEVT